MWTQSKEKLLLSLRTLGFNLSLKINSNIPRTILRRLFRHTKTTITVTDFDEDLTMILRLSEHMQRRIFWMGYYSADIACLLKKIITPGMTILDIGANIGEIALLAGKRVGGTGKVFAFEPIDEIAQQLKLHITKNRLHQISIEKYALSDSVDNKTPIYASCGQQVDDEHSGLGSLYSGKEVDKPLQYIQMTTLDAWLSNQDTIQRVDLIKIDIEGAELACLRGARDCLLRFSPQIIIEIQSFSAARAGYKPEDVLEFLSELDYEFHSIGRSGALTPLTPAKLRDFQNVFCTPRGREMIKR